MALEKIHWPTLIESILASEQPYTLKFKKTWLGVMNDINRVTVATREDDLSMMLSVKSGADPVETAVRWRRMVESEILRMVVAKLSDMDQSAAWALGKARKGLPKDTPIEDDDKMKLRTENRIVSELMAFMNERVKETDLLRCFRDSCQGRSLRNETNRIVGEAIEDAQKYIEKHITNANNLGTSEGGIQPGSSFDSSVARSEDETSSDAKPIDVPSGQVQMGSGRSA